MKRGALTTIVTLLLGFGFATYWVLKSSSANRSQRISAPDSARTMATPTGRVSPGPPATTHEGDQAKAATIVKEVFTAPISFFGRVRDQNGLAISGADVEFRAIDRFWEPGSKYRATSNADGSFSIVGINGAGLTVAVSKEGFDGIDGLSYQSFGYGMPPDSTRKIPPTPNSPALFVLRRKAAAEALYEVRRDIAVPKDGTPVNVSLRTGKPVSHGEGDIMIECRTSDDAKDVQGHYDWHARLSVPGGGLIHRRNPGTDFTAPESGYEPAIELGMAQNAKDWRRDSDEQYWVKLRNGTFGRMRFRFTTGGRHFATISSYLNPSGSRNLEYDENKVIR